MFHGLIKWNLILLFKQNYANRTAKFTLAIFFAHLNVGNDLTLDELVFIYPHFLILFLTNLSLPPPRLSDATFSRSPQSRRCRPVSPIRASVLPEEKRHLQGLFYTDWHFRQFSFSSYIELNYETKFSSK